MKSSSYQFMCVVIHVVTSSHYIYLISATCALPDPIHNTIATLPNQTLETGSYIRWECSDGYMMDGLTNTAVWVCLEDGSWLGHTPICTAIVCPSPPIAAYSRLDPLLAEDPLVNQTIVYRCSSSNYTLLGSNLNRCLQDGTWENDPPVCQRDCGDTDNYVKRYSNLTCYRQRGNTNSPTIWIESKNLCNAKGELLATVKDAETQTFLVEFIGDQIGDRVWIGAMEGRDWMWRHSGVYIERFFWQNSFPSANSEDCIELSYQDGSFSWSPRSNQTGNGLLCQYETRMNYVQWNDGQPNNRNQDQDCVEMKGRFQYRWNDRTCSNPSRTLCQIGIPACGDPGEPLKGHRLPDDRTTYSVGATLHFTCQKGYTLSGESVLTCMNNGTWNHQRPSCEAVKCEGSPPEVALASTMIQGSVYQDIALYTCQDGYIPDNEPISFCQHTGNWSTPSFTCSENLEGNSSRNRGVVRLNLSNPLMKT